VNYFFGAWALTAVVREEKVPKERGKSLLGTRLKLLEKLYSEIRIWIVRQMWAQNQPAEWIPRILDLNMSFINVNPAQKNQIEIAKRMKKSRIGIGKYMGLRRELKWETKLKMGTIANRSNAPPIYPAKQCISKPDVIMVSGRIFPTAPGVAHYKRQVRRVLRIKLQARNGTIQCSTTTLNMLHIKNELR
jgi:hypothetical protein